MASQSQSPQLKAVHEFFDALASYDRETLSAALAPSYAHTFLPSSLATAMKWPEVIDKEHILTVVETSIWQLIKGLKVVPVDIIEAGDTIIVHSKAAETAKGAFTGSPHTQEYVHIFKVEAQADGAYKVANVKEMIDSKFTAEWFTAEVTAAASAASVTVD